MLDYYLKLQESYGWTPLQIDAQPLDVLLDEIVVFAKKQDAEEMVFIDEIM